MNKFLSILRFQLLCFDVRKVKVYFKRFFQSMNLFTIFENEYFKCLCFDQQYSLFNGITLWKRKRRAINGNIYTSLELVFNDKKALIWLDDEVVLVESLERKQSKMCNFLDQIKYEIQYIRLYDRIITTIREIVKKEETMQFAYEAGQSLIKGFKKIEI